MALAEWCRQSKLVNLFGAAAKKRIKTGKKKAGTVREKRAWGGQNGEGGEELSDVKNAVKWCKKRSETVEKTFIVERSEVVSKSFIVKRSETVKKKPAT